MFQINELVFVMHKIASGSLNKISAPNSIRVYFYSRAGIWWRDLSFLYDLA